MEAPVVLSPLLLVEWRKKLLEILGKPGTIEGIEDGHTLKTMVDQLESCIDFTNDLQVENHPEYGE